MAPGPQPVRGAEALLVARAGEDGEDLFDDLGGGGLAALQAQHLSLHAGARGSRLVAGGGRGGVRSVERVCGRREPAELDQRGSEVGEQVCEPCVVAGHQRSGALEQGDRCGPVAAPERPAPRRL
jgi:hypothetical protein